MIACGLLLLLSAPAFAQLRGSVDVDVALTSPADPQETAHEQTVPLKGGLVPVIKGGSGKIVNINVLDYNPVFYTYSVKDEKAPTASAKALDDIIAKLKPFAQPNTSEGTVAIKADSLGAETPGSTKLNNIDISQLVANLYKAAKGITSDLPDLLQQLATASDAQTLRTAVSAKIGTLRDASKAAKDAGSSLLQLQDLFNQSFAGTGNFTVSYFDSGSNLQRYPAAGAPPARSLGALLQGMSGLPDRGAHLAYDQLEQILGFGDNRYADYRDLASNFSTLVDQLPAVGVRTTLHTPQKDWPDFESGSDNTVTISVAANTAFKSLLTGVSSDIGKHTGEYKILLKTRELIDLAISAAVIYSFVKNPSYSAQTAGGGLKVAQTTNDYNKVSGALAFNMTPAAWSDYFVRPHIQIGMVPDSGKTAALLGLGFSAGLPTFKSSGDSSKQKSSPSQLDFNFGAIYQKATQLGAGLSVGQALATSQDLKTETAYKVGFYLGIGYSFK